MLFLAKLVRLVATVVVAFLIAGIAIHVFEADTGAAVVGFIDDTARWLAGPFDGVFAPDDPKVAIAANWGLAALVYGLLGGLIASLLVRARVGMSRARRRHHERRERPGLLHRWRWRRHRMTGV